MKNRRNASLDDALNRLAKAEADLVGSQFLAPVLRGKGVVVRIAGVRCAMKVSPEDFEGWGVFRAESTDRAVRVRDATMAERRAYLVLFPAVRLILVGRNAAGGDWSGVPAGAADARFSVEGTIPVRL